VIPAVLFFAATVAADLGPLLERRFTDPLLNYIVIDARTRETLAARWPDAAVAVPVGSTVKPFLSLAYVGAFPNTRCEGHTRFREALAYSCNPYFLALARDVSSDALARIAAVFEIAGPADDLPETFIGLGRGWRIAPIDLVRAYAELGKRRGIPRVAEILDGLELAAEHGTASAIGHGALAKTGTAECVAERKHAGDGFTVVLDPADAPRVALIVRVHNVPGAEAAKVAAQILRVVRTGK
jgi:hypothetical protein